MSLRRKSCETCFQGRRKCDLARPVCGRCQKTRTQCCYRYPRDRKTSTGNDDPRPMVAHLNNPLLHHSNQSTSQDYDDGVETTNINTDQILRCNWSDLSIPNNLGPLGALQPVTGYTKSWKWVVSQLKSYPQDFAAHGDNAFIQRKLYRDSFPQTIRAAFGLSAACSYLNEQNKLHYFQRIDAEIWELLKLPEDGTLLENLSNLQAMVIYQIIRLLHGDLKQRMNAEQQEGFMGMRGLQLLHKANLHFPISEQTWESWLLGESIRRTVITTFMLYGINSIFKYGICSGFPTLSTLPISTSPSSWSSEAAFLSDLDPHTTVTYDQYTKGWLASQPRILEPFEKMLLVACKGIDQVEALSYPDVSL